MLKLLLILFVGLVFEAIGVVFLDRGMHQIVAMQREPGLAILETAKHAVGNRSFLSGVFFEALFFAGLLYLMAHADVSFIWPMTSLGFLLTTLAARFLLGEEVSFARWAGVCLIVLGAGLITWTEQTKREAHHHRPPPAKSALNVVGKP